MKLLLIRLLPLLSAFVTVFMCAWVERVPLAYPWPLVAALVWFVAAIVFIGWERIPHRDLIGRMLPAVCVLCAVSLGFLLENNATQHWLLTVLLALAEWLALELLFLSAFDPSRYPVNALSHLNLALIPIGAFFLAAVMNSFSIFLRLSFWIPLVSWTAFAGLLYFFTSHPSASRRDRWRWGSLGAGIGLHIGWLTMLLPLSIAVHGALAALFLSVPLRVRRYGYQPLPSRRTAWSEGVLGLGLFIGLLVFSRWS